MATGALLHGPDDRSQASCSDVIAAAVRELLEADPLPLLERLAAALGLRLSVSFQPGERRTA